jgi:Zn-dependent peptidase ImmA (M78 family)
MSGYDFVVPPVSWDKIAEMTDGIRDQFGLGTLAYFPVMDFIERVLDQRMNIVNFEVADKQEMMSAEGYTDPNGEFIILRDDVYHGACAGDGRSRFTAAHELGHLALHTRIPLARAKAEERVPPYRLSEPQANQFAAELLMPRKFMFISDTIELVMTRHGVSHEAASNRLKFLGSKGLLKK